MGSSKKHKERDRERSEHKKKRRHRSRSKSPSSNKRSKRDRQSPTEKLEPRVKDEPIENADVNESVDEKAGAGDSLSIAETNKLREKLGLKPLDVSDVKPDPDGASSANKEDIHVPAKNLGAIKKEEKIREKMALLKEKRRLKKTLGKVKTLGESDSDDEDVLGWIKKSRRIDEEKKKAEKRAKMLEEMDEEFGIGDLVDEAFSKKPLGYSSKDLKGLTVKHDEADFVEGKSVVLTLEDKNVLDQEGGDALVNVNMMDHERVQKNIENKKMKPDYNPYEEFDEDGMFQHKDILSKYNEEIQGESKKSFALGSRGSYDASHEKAMRQYKEDLVSQRESLSLPPPKIASEFYTEGEMESFKKVRRKKTRKIRKKPKALTADDLMALEGQETSQDYGSRSRGRGRIKEEVEGENGEGNAIPGLDLVEDMEVDDKELVTESDIVGPEEDLSGIVIDDEAGNELQSALAKSRRLKQKKHVNLPEQIVGQHVALRGLQKEDTSDEEDNVDPLTLSSSSQQQNKAILLDSTSEFCRALGEIPTYGMSGNRLEEEEDEVMDFEREIVAQHQLTEEESGSRWQKVDIDTEPVDITPSEQTVLDEEPVVDSGLASALSLAKKKGYLMEEETKKGSRVVTNTMPDVDGNYSIEDKRYDDLDDKYKRRDRFGGGVTQDFKELEHYKPNVKLEYVDDSGRSLNSKEAFRQLSHRFHGKGSGKKKIEKRSRKIEQETLLLTASSSDTPLGTVEMMRNKQKVEQLPYVLLTGNKFGGGSISK